MQKLVIMTHGLPNIKAAEKPCGEIIKGYDLIMVTAAHSNVDYGMVQENARFIFDTKNVMKGILKRENIEVL